MLKKLKVIVLVLAVMSCATTSDVVFEFDETATFDDYTTFVLCIDDLFVENTDFPQYDNNAIRGLIGEEIEKQMVKLGHKTNVIKPQLQAGFELIVEEKETTFTNCEHQDEYSYWKDCTIDTMIYTEETLVVYVSDFDRNQIIWQASLVCNTNRSDAKLKSYIADLIQSLFDTYPRS